MKVLDPETDQIEIPVECDPEAVELLAKIREDGCAIASEGTDRHGLMDRLAGAGYLIASLCPRAGGVTQFTPARRVDDFFSGSGAVA